MAAWRTRSSGEGARGVPNEAEGKPMVDVQRGPDQLLAHAGVLDTVRDGVAGI